MPVTVKIEGVSRLLDNLRDLEKRQIPFILAKSLTDTAKDAQKASQQSLTERSAFTLRNKWTEGGIRIKPALKSSAGGRIEADVHTDLAKGGGVDYLQIQDSDYVRAPTGHHYLCIPTDILRRMAGGKSAIIPDELRPANLLRYADGKFKYAVTRGKMKGTLRRVRSPAVRGMVFFTDSGGMPIHLKSGARGIWGRTIGDPRQAYLLYVMVEHTKSIRKRFFLEDVVKEVVEESFARNWEKNWNELYAKGFRV